MGGEEECSRPCQSARHVSDMGWDPQQQPSQPVGTTE